MSISDLLLLAQGRSFSNPKFAFNLKINQLLLAFFSKINSKTCNPCPDRFVRHSCGAGQSFLLSMGLAHKLIWSFFF